MPFRCCGVRRAARSRPGRIAAATVTLTATTATPIVARRSGSISRVTRPSTPASRTPWRAAMSRVRFWTRSTPT
ncbi:hypothetical protein ACFQHO_32505 [Actinomadura yumaensis]|uniref:hypothetical protein n=1 Tax=Actinomadura yumaensis TaxID=111807 RepID=UPI00361303D8